MLKGFFYTKRYSFWDLLPLTIISAAARHDDYAIAGVVLVIAIVIGATIDWYYEK